MNSTLYNIKGEKTGTVDLPEGIFGLPWNADLVHQVVTSMQSNARTNTTHTKTRGEVRGGGRKPWQQKGTGRARHGSSRSPIWVGGGVAHGPRKDKNYTRKINKTMRRKALLVTLSRKYKDGEVLFVDFLEMQTPQAKAAKQFLSAFAKVASGFAKKKNAALIALPVAHRPTERSFSNFGNIEVADVRNLNPLTLLQSKYLVIANPAAAFETLGKKGSFDSASDK